MGLREWWPGFSEAFLTVQMAVLTGWEESRRRDGAILFFWLGKETRSCQSHAPSLWPRTLKTLEILDRVHAHLDSTVTFLSLSFIFKLSLLHRALLLRCSGLCKTCLQKAQAAAVLVWPLLLAKAALWVPLLLCAQGLVPAHGDNAFVGKHTVPGPG